MAKLPITKLLAVALSIYSPAAGAAVIIQNMHASGYIIEGSVAEGYGEYFNNYANLAGKKVTIDITTTYTGTDIFDNLVKLKFKIDTPDVYTYYFSLPGADPDSGKYYCGCDGEYDHGEAIGYVGTDLPTIKDGTFIWDPSVAQAFLHLKGPVSGSTSFGPVVPALVGDLQTSLSSNLGGGNASFSFVLTDVKATLVDLSAVPEPTSWAMMFGGFAIIGGAMRRRRTLTEFSRAD